MVVRFGGLLVGRLPSMVSYSVFESFENNAA